MEESEILGEWSDSIQAFWFGANCCEWVAWKGSNQVFVYPCDNYSDLPKYVIQHKERIETLEEFTKAIYSGKVYEPEYKEVEVYWQK